MVRQKPGRQIRKLLQAGVDIDKIYFDLGASGKDFDRPEFKRMCHRLQAGDVLVLQSVDRFGRNCFEALAEWNRLEERGITIFVLDMPNLLRRDNTRSDSERQYGRFLLMMHAFEAEQERLRMLERQAQGFENARKAGKILGRPVKPLPRGFKAAFARYKNREITGIQAALQCNMPQSTFYHKAKALIEAEQNSATQA